jgi:uncharacterized membrane protein
LGKIRPQVLASISILGAIALYGLSLGNIEVATACIGGITALSMKLLEDD